MKLPAESVPPSPPSPDPSDDPLPDLEPANPAPVNLADIPLPGVQSLATAAATIAAPISIEPFGIDAAIRLLAFLIRQEPPPDRNIILHRVIREIEDKVYGGR